MALVALGMLMLAYASVPLYRLFCQVTGFGGTTMQATELPGPDEIVDRVITVRFNADIAPDLPWKFAPKQNEVTVKLGEEITVYYEATNLADTATTGTSIYNVTPLKVGSYYNKIQCFCFQEQTINPGETTEFPVTLFVDPDLENDRNMDEISRSIPKTKH